MHARSRHEKIVVQPPADIPRLSPDDSRLAQDKVSELLEVYRPMFRSTLELQAVELEGRQLGSLLHNKAVAPHFFNAVGYRHVRSHPSGDTQRRLLVLNLRQGESLPSDAQAELDKLGLQLIPFTVELGWEQQTSDAVLEYMLPADLVKAEGVPTGFTVVGHIAHLNLIQDYLPFRYLVGAVILEKNKGAIRTVVNKLDSIDTQFRFFKMELLAGDEDYTAHVSESDCVFSFDFRTVYWNSRLHGEHARLIRQFRPNQVVADVMAGVGPFAVPAAKRGVWVLANDLNPKSYESLVRNARANHVLAWSQDGDARDCAVFDGGVWASCVDGRDFIRQSIRRAWTEGAAAFRGRPVGPGMEDDEVLREYGRKAVKARQKAKRAEYAAKQAGTSAPAAAAAAAAAASGVERERPRRVVDHFVMNLPASALEFLDAFRGAYSALGVDRAAIEAESDGHMPWVHVHCFSKDPLRPVLDVLNRANAALGIAPDAPWALVGRPILPPQTSTAGRRATRILLPDGLGCPTTQDELDSILASCSSTESLMHFLESDFAARNQSPTPGLHIEYVRDVAPNKQMYCISFQLPPQVLFA